MACCECKCTDARPCPGGCVMLPLGACSRCVAVAGLRRLKAKWRSAATRLRTQCQSRAFTATQKSWISRQADQLDDNARELEGLMDATHGARNDEAWARMEGRFSYLKGHG